MPRIKTIAIVFLFAVIFAPLAIWVEIQRCVWIHSGSSPCGGFVPFVLIFFGLLEGPLFFLILLALLRLLRIQSFIKFAAWIVASGLIVQGGFFYFANYRRTAIMEAARTGDKSATEYWLRLGADPNATSAFGTRSPLFLAVESGSIKTVETLLKNGANPDGPGNCNIYHPLSKAFIDKNPVMAELLLSYGATYPCEKIKQLLIDRYDYRRSDFNQ